MGSNKRPHEGLIYSSIVWVNEEECVILSMPVLYRTLSCLRARIKSPCPQGTPAQHGVWHSINNVTTCIYTHAEASPPSWGGLLAWLPADHSLTSLLLLPGYVCKCPPQFYGEHCEQRKENCTLTPCLEDGTCTFSPEGASCNCSQPYPGDR